PCERFEPPSIVCPSRLIESAEARMPTTRWTIPWFLFFSAACTNEKIVYRDRQPFNPPADAASGFLGYYNASTKTTTCGNCHVGHQTDWKATAHASAYKTLADLPAGVAQPTCYNCHTVNDNGNKTTGNVGYKAVKDSAYFDVQCESCHGPGYAHVQ